MSLLAAGLIAGAVSAVANGVGSVAASKASKEAYDAQQAAMNKKEARLANWRNRIVNEDPTQTGSASRMLTRLDEILRKRNQAVAGQQAVMGGTDASVAAQKEQSNQVLADAASQIVANADAKREKAEDAYLSGQMNIDDQRSAAESARSAQRIQAIQTAAQGVGQAAGSFLNAYAMQGGGTATQKAITNQNGN